MQGKFLIARETVPAVTPQTSRRDLFWISTFKGVESNANGQISSNGSGT